MGKRRATINILTVFLFSILFFASTPMQKAYAKEKVIAEMTAFKGHLNIIRDGTTIPPAVNMDLLNNDRINVFEGRAEILFYDGSTLLLLTNTEIIIKESLKKREVSGALKRSYTFRLIKIVSGRLWANIIPMADIKTEFETDAAIMQLNRGTVEIGIGFATGTVSIGCPKGEVTVRVVIAGITYKVVLTTGQSTTIIPGTPPTPPAPYNPGIIAPVDPETKKRMMKPTLKPKAAESPPDTIAQEPPPAPSSPWSP